MARTRYTFLVEFEVDTTRLGEQVAAMATGAYPHREKRDVSEGLRPVHAVLVKTENMPEHAIETACAMPGTEWTPVRA